MTRRLRNLAFLAMLGAAIAAFGTQQAIAARAWGDTPSASVELFHAVCEPGGFPGTLECEDDELCENLQDSDCEEPCDDEGMGGGTTFLVGCVDDGEESSYDCICDIDP